MIASATRSADLAKWLGSLLLGPAFICITTGMLISPPDAVHRLNHDYHAVFQQRVTDSRSTPRHAISAMVFGISRWSAACRYIADDSCHESVVNSSPVLGIIQTWRLLL